MLRALRSRAANFVSRSTRPQPNIPKANLSWLDHPARDPHLLSNFTQFLHSRRNASVLEMGVCQSRPGNSTMHRDWAADDAKWTGTDFQNGLDVDVVADAHTMSKSFPLNHFDGIISVSVFEHIQYPWIAAVEVAKILKPGGRIFIHVPWMFPYHAYPGDYFRYSKEGLRSLFEPVGLKVVGSDYEAPCVVVCEADPGIQGLEAFSSTRMVLEKPL